MPGAPPPISNRLEAKNFCLCLFPKISWGACFSIRKADSEGAPPHPGKKKKNIHKGKYLCGFRESKMTPRGNVMTPTASPTARFFPFY